MVEELHTDYTLEDLVSFTIRHILR